MSQTEFDFNPIYATIVKGDNVKNEKRDPDKEPNRDDEKRLYLEFPTYGTHKNEDGTDVQNKYILGVPDPRHLKYFIDTSSEMHNHHYRIWKNFLNDTKRGKHIIVPTDMFRARALIRGKVTDFYIVRVQARGWANDERQQQYDVDIGTYDTVTFTKERDIKSGEWKTTGVDKRIPVYEFIYDRNNEESKKAMQYWFDHSDGSMKFYVYPLLGGSKPMQVIDFETFRDASHFELMECAKRNIILSEFKEYARMFSNSPSLTVKPAKNNS